MKIFIDYSLIPDHDEWSKPRKQKLPLKLEAIQKIFLDALAPMAEKNDKECPIIIMSAEDGRQNSQVLKLEQYSEGLMEKIIKRLENAI